MPLDSAIRNVLVIGSGPVVIGQAAEFDYSGSQACLVIRENGLHVTLLNPNPATIQTDYSIADRIYIEPINSEVIKSIIKKERIDSIVASVGGQTALNAAMELYRQNVLDDSVRILGTSPGSIEIAEDRRKFHELMKKIGEPVPDSFVAKNDNLHDLLRQIPESSYIVRTSFSLGGMGGVVVKDLDELNSYAANFFSDNPGEELEIEKSILGLKEIEYEMIRDNAGNCISICNMENLDPMGVHTGESIVVTPSQTLSDNEIQKLRSAAIKIISAIGIIGACNIQFAIDDVTGDYYVVEVNPRTSRSSALASKASGYPIARISTRILLGYNLTEIKNPLTKNTSAAFEPSLDYITVKIPRWPFDKLAVNRQIGVQMRSVGEVMGIGVTFEESLMKAIASLDTPESRKLRLYRSSEETISLLARPNDLRLYAIFDALMIGIDADSISSYSGINVYFIEKIKNIVAGIKAIRVGEIPLNLRELKKLGVSDSIIASLSRLHEIDIIRYRMENSIMPSFRAIDTCSAEFASSTPYLYSTYNGNDENTITDSKKILILGSGPNRIAQGLEFDYGSVKASLALRSLGIESLMINCNPETVSTDFDFSSKLYFEPLTLEHVSNIMHAERELSIIIQFSGQTGQNMAAGLSELFGEDCFIGTKPSDIERIEERTKFAQAIEKLHLKQPPFSIVRNENDAIIGFNKIRLPVIIRSSFIIGGRAMDIIYDRTAGISRIREVLTSFPEHPVLISEYLENSTELDVDFISDGKKSLIAGISVHLEEAGIHSGDAMSVIGPNLVDDASREEIISIVDRLTEEFHLKGLSNLQIALNKSGIYIIELNARSSRSVPYVSKAIGRDVTLTAIKFSLGIDRAEGALIEPASFFCKVPIFPFKRFPEHDILLSPEMKSTGEGLGIGKTFEEAVLKAFNIQNHKFNGSGGCLISVNDFYKDMIIDVAKDLKREGILLFSTPGTHNFLREKGVESFLVFKIGDERRPTVRDILENQDIMMIINLPNRSTGSIADGFEIRRVATAKNIPVVTNLNLAKAIVRSIAKKPRMVPRELNEYYDQ